MPPSYIRVRAVVWAYGRGQTDRQTDTQTRWPQYILRRLRLTQNVITAISLLIRCVNWWRSLCDSEVANCPLPGYCSRYHHIINVASSSATVSVIGVVHRDVAVWFPVHRRRSKALPVDGSISRSRRHTSANITPKIGHFVEKWSIERYISLVPLRKKYPKMRFFSQNGAETTSGFGFHFIFELHVLELIENDINIDRLCWRFFEILGVKFKFFLNYANELRAFCKKKFIWLFIAVAGPYHRGEIYAVLCKNKTLKDV